MAGKMYRTNDFGGNIGEKAAPLTRISYAQGLHKPQQNDNGSDRYGVTLIVPKDKAKVFQDAVKEVILGQWGEKGVERFQKGLIKNPIIPGDGKQAHDKDGNLKPGMGPDVIFIRTSSGFAAKVFGPSGHPMDPADVKSGWWGYPVLNAFAWHNPKNGDGVSFGLSMWMHAKEDETLGGDGGGDPSRFFEQVQTGDDGNDVSGGAGDMFG